MPFPTTQAGPLVCSEVGDTLLTLSWPRGNGIEVIAVGRLTSSVLHLPADNVSYTANSVYGSGTDIGDGNFVLYKGTGTSVVVTGLTHSTSFTFYVYEVNRKSAGSEKYNTTLVSAVQTMQATVNAPTVQATNLIQVGSERIEWTASGDAIRYLLVAKKGSAVDATPSDTVTYAADLNFGSGDQIGTGNYVLAATTSLYAVNIKNLDPSTTFHFRVFAYNVAGTGPKYITSTDTGNPLNFTTEAAQTWFMHNEPIVQPMKYAHDIKAVSQVVSKTSIIGYVETADEYQVYFIADNNANLYPEPWHFDQTFLAYKSKTDGLDFKYGWTVYSTSPPEPTPVFMMYDETVHSGINHTIQNHLTNPIFESGTNLIAAYVANEANIATRYNIGIARSTDNGRTWTRNSTYVVNANSTHSYYHAVLIKDTSNYFIIVENNITTKYECWKSTDGLTGNAYALLCADVIADVDAWSDDANPAVSGWPGIGPMYKDGSGWHFMVTRTLSSQFHTNPISFPTRIAYGGGLLKTIAEAHVTTWDTATPKIIIDREIWTSNESVSMAVYPGTYRITHGGTEHIICGSFMYRIENTAQNIIDMKVLSDTPMLDSAFVVGNEVWPDIVTHYYIPHDSRVNDTYTGAAVGATDFITGVSGTYVGSPTQYALDMIYATSSNYVTFPSWTHNQQYLGFKFVAPLTTLNDNVNKGMFEKSGTLKVWTYQGRYLEIWVYGDNGNIKKYRTVLGYGNYLAGSFSPPQVVIGVVLLYNGVDDIDVHINIDNWLDVPMTAIHSGEQKFTNIMQNTNILTVGFVSGLATIDYPFGQLAIFEGSGLTQTKWLNFNLI